MSRKQEAQASLQDALGQNGKVDFPMAHISSSDSIDKKDRLSGAGLPWPLHPACSAWPEMSPAELRDLADDIATHGLHDPITLTPDNFLLDGRNRAFACVMAAVEPKTVVHDGDPWLFSLSRNKHRRHMSQDQIAMVVAELVTTKPLGANQHEGGPIELPSVAQAAENAGIAETALKSAKVVHLHGTPDEIRAVKSGAVPLYKKADDVRKRKRALAPPAGPRPAPPPERVVYPIEVVANDIIAKCPTGKWLPISKIATAVGVPENIAKEALKDLGPEFVETCPNGSAIEYRIDSVDQTRLNRSLAAKDQEIADLKARIAEQDAEIERLTELLTAPSASTPPARKRQRAKPESDSTNLTVN
jgi:hypothetical protein